MNHKFAFDVNVSFNKPKSGAAAPPTATGSAAAVNTEFNREVQHREGQPDDERAGHQVDLRDPHGPSDQGRQVDVVVRDNRRMSLHARPPDFIKDKYFGVVDKPKHVDEDQPPVTKPKPPDSVKDKHLDTVIPDTSIALLHARPHDSVKGKNLGVVDWLKPFKPRRVKEGHSVMLKPISAPLHARPPDFIKDKDFGVVEKPKHVKEVQSSVIKPKSPDLVKDKYLDTIIPAGSIHDIQQTTSSISLLHDRPHDSVKDTNLGVVDCLKPFKPRHVNYMPGHTTPLRATTLVSLIVSSHSSPGTLRKSTRSTSGR